MIKGKSLFQRVRGILIIATGYSLLKRKIAPIPSYLLSKEKKPKQLDFDYDSFVKEYSSPIGYEVLKDAVTLVPCSHKINLAEAIEYYGQRNDWKVFTLNQCAICNGRVTGYIDDIPTRSKVTTLFYSTTENTFLLELRKRAYFPDPNAVEEALKRIQAPKPRPASPPVREYNFRLGQGIDDDDEDIEDFGTGGFSS